MSSSIKEIIFKFIVVFLVLIIIGHFIKWLDMGVIRALPIAVGISIADLIAYTFRKYRRQ